MLSGVAMIVVGVWLAAQGIAGNLAARLRDFAQGERRGVTFSGFGGGSGFGGPGSSSGGSGF